MILYYIETMFYYLFLKIQIGLSGYKLNLFDYYYSE
jgi:hypothetical protein